MYMLCRWYSAFHNVTAVVGAGVLGLPYAMKVGCTEASSFPVHCAALSYANVIRLIIQGARADRPHAGIFNSMLQSKPLREGHAQLPLDIDACTVTQHTDMVSSLRVALHFAVPHMGGRSFLSGTGVVDFPLHAGPTLCDARDGRQTLLPVPRARRVRLR